VVWRLATRSHLCPVAILDRLREERSAVAVAAPALSPEYPPRTNPLSQCRLLINYGYVAK